VLFRSQVRMSALTLSDSIKDKVFALVAECHEKDTIDQLIETFNQAITTIEQSLTPNSSSKPAPSKDDKIESIITAITDYIGDNVLALAPGEDISIPEWSGSFADHCPGNTVHVDGFLYDEDDVDRLVDQGKLARNRCNQCQSLDVKPLNFISHSASLHQLRYLMEVPLKSYLSTPNSCILDVGSRLGSVLYAAHLYTPATNIIGVEMNDYFYKLQSTIVKDQELNDRITLFNADITSHVGVRILNGESGLPRPGIVMLNNVFQFFVGKDEEITSSKRKNTGQIGGRERVQQIWMILRHVINVPGTIIVSMPSLEEQFEDAGVDIDIPAWVKEIQQDEEAIDEFGEAYGLEDWMVDDLKGIWMYKVV